MVSTILQLRELVSLGITDTNYLVSEQYHFYNQHKLLSRYSKMGFGRQRHTFMSV